MPELSKLIKVSMDQEQINKVVAVDVMKLKASDLVVSNQTEYEDAADTLGAISNRITELDAMRKTVKAPILEAGRNIDAMFKVPLEQGRAAKKTVQSKMLDYVALVEYGKKLAEEQAAKIAKEQKEKAEEEALALIANGDDDAAQEILDNVDMMPVPTETIESPKAAGISTRANWKCRVIDLNKLVRSIMQGKAPIDLIQVNQTVANQYAKAMRDTLKIEGLEFYNDATLAVRKVK
jgi:hypothetical protein